MTPQSTNRPHPDAMRELRFQALTTPPEKFGVLRTADFPRVYGVVMDWPIGEHTVTVVSLCDGNASLYTTSTFGVIGGIGHEAVRKEARAFVKFAQQYFDGGSPTSEFPYPKADCVLFYLLTFDGVRVLGAPLRAVGEGEHKLAPLFARGQSVVTELRLIVQNDTESGEKDAQPERRSGAQGYVNCLLTCMSDGVFRSVDIVASKPVPNLLELTDGHGELMDWIQAQEFQSHSINPREVIRIIKYSARIRGVPFLMRRGDLPTIHAQEDGKATARVFDISIGPFDRSAKIDLAAENDPRVVALQRETEEKKG